MSLALGAFDLIRPIASGGMAEVWQGVHRAQHIPVAIKVITGGQALLPEFLHAFRNEVHAVAGLDHPNIVMVFDYGEISEETAERSGGVLHAGSPYLVMELADQGTLAQLQAPVPWATLREMILSLLDALSHAHARGVIHRDLKPANVLISSPDGIRPGIKLSDFGIAHGNMWHTQQTDDFEGVMGTPCYMAPEQVEGAWRHFGPWTDLYALGCMIFELVTGKPPFLDDNLIRLAYCHLHQPPPPLRNANLYPDGFEAWLLRLLAKSITTRFRSAADAAWALTQLDAPKPLHRSASVDPLLDLIPPSHELFSTPSKSAPAQVHPNDLFVSVAQSDLPPASIPPLPDTWRPNYTTKLSMKLVGAGLNLYGLRSVPLVGRVKERDRIWQQLTSVRAQNRAKCVLLKGAAGTGKTRLMEWVAQRAFEVGSATVLHALHSPTPSPADGLARMLARHVRCVNTQRDTALNHIRQTYMSMGVQDEYAWNALTEMISPLRAQRRTLSSLLAATSSEDTSSPQPIRFSTPQQRYNLILDFLRLLSRERPVILRLDDVQWGYDALAFAQHLLRHATNTPILILMTVRDEALAMQPVTKDKLEELMESEHTITLPIEPLTTSEHKELVTSLLGLAGSLCDDVVRRTSGNPLFAVQLIGDWVQRSVLRVADHGFVLEEGAEALIPDTLYEVWNARIDQIVHWLSEEAGHTLELAAILGYEVNNREWEMACAEAGLVYSEILAHALLAQRLAVACTDGWVFAHSILRETLERRAHEHGRDGEYHRACAEMLRMEYPPDHLEASERIGLHYMRAGLHESALEPLLRGARRRREQSDFRHAHDLLQHRDKALKTLQIPLSDARWGESWVLRSWICSNQARVVDAWAWAEEACNHARRYDWGEILPSALLGMAVAARDSGQLQRSTTLFTEALELFQQHNDRMGQAHCLQGLGVIARLRAQPKRASNQLREALNLHQLIENQHGIALCVERLAEVALSCGSLQDAHKLLRKAQGLYTTLHDPLGSMRVLLLQGELERYQRNHQHALALHTSTLAQASSSAPHIQPHVELALALTHIAGQSYADALPLLESAYETFHAQGLKTALWSVTAAFLPCAARSRSVDLWERSMGMLEKQAFTSGFVSHDVAVCLEKAGRVMVHNGDVQRARVALDWARQHWQALQIPKRVEAVQSLLQQIA